MGGVDGQGVGAEMPELGQGQRARVRAGAGPGRTGAADGQEQLAEGPGVDETQLVGLAESQHGVGVGGPGRRPAAARSWPLIRRWTTSTRPSSPFQEQVLAVAADADQPLAGQRGQRRRRVPAHRPPAR